MGERGRRLDKKEAGLKEAWRIEFFHPPQPADSEVPECANIYDIQPVQGSMLVKKPVAETMARFLKAPICNVCSATYLSRVVPA